MREKEREEEGKRTPGSRRVSVDFKRNSKATRTNRRSLCSKLCKTAPDDSYRGGIPRARVRQSAFEPRRESRLLEVSRARMTSWAIPGRPIPVERASTVSQRSTTLALSHETGELICVARRLGYY